MISASTLNTIVNDGAIECLGAEAGVSGEPLAANPYVHSSWEGQLWTRGWIQGEAYRRQELGTYGATPDAIAEAAAVFDRRPDPVLEILGPGAYDAPPRRRNEPKRIHVPTDRELAAEYAAELVVDLLAGPWERLSDALERISSRARGR